MPYFDKLTVGLVALLLFTSTFVAALYLFQNKLLYLPTKASLDDYVPLGMTRWSASTTTEGGPAPDEILGLLAEPTAGLPITETAIVFHGNAGHAGHRDYYAQQLTRLGIRVILAEYPGYGPRSGTPDESVLIDDAAHVASLAHQRYGPPIWLVGESLGAGVVAAVAGREPSIIQGVVLVTPWRRLVDG